MKLEEKKAKAILWSAIWVGRMVNDIQEAYNQWASLGELATKDIISHSKALHVFATIHQHVYSDNLDLDPETYHFLVGSILVMHENERLKAEREMLYGIIELFRYQDDRPPIFVTSDQIRSEWQHSGLGLPSRVQ